MRAEIFVSVEVRKIINIDENANSFTVSKYVTYEWKDSNVEYNYLKDNVNENLVHNSPDFKKIWQTYLRVYHESPGVKMTPSWGRNMVR